MDFAQFALLATFALGLVLITFEHELGVEKWATALVTNGIMWLIVSVFITTDFEHDLEESGWEITQIVFFLLYAMALVELASRLGFFELVRAKLIEQNWRDKQQFIALMVLTFFLSAILDNLTTAIVMVEVCRRFFRGRNLLIVASGVVIMANAGGAWSPLGDVTTIMLWLDGKFTASEIVTQAFLPAAAHALVAGWLLMRQLEVETYPDSREDLPLAFSLQSKVLMASTLSCFSLPFIATQFSLPPYYGIGFGFGVIAVLLSILGRQAQQPHSETVGGSGQMTHMQHDIDEVLKEVDFKSLIFFVGILSAVSALGAGHVLEQISQAAFGSEPSFARVMIGNTFMGWGSAIVDNVPLTAVAIDAIPTIDPLLWTLLAYAVGTGGSHLIVGSAAGVVTMGRVKELTSLAYLKIATVPVLLAYLAGIGVWVAQLPLFR